MTDAEKLTKVIEKAEKNGFDLDKWYYNNHICVDYDIVIKKLLQTLFYKLLLIDHEFARCYFGEEKITVDVTWASGEKQNYTFGYDKNMKSWQFHFQQAVVSDNMLNYYYERL